MFKYAIRTESKDYTKMYFCYYNHKVNEYLLQFLCLSNDSIVEQRATQSEGDQRRVKHSRIERNNEE